MVNKSIYNPCKRPHSFPFRKDNIEYNVPTDSGIYIFWSGLLCLYVGQALNLQDRLFTHWRKSHSDDVNLWITALGSKLCLSYELVGKKRLSTTEQLYIDRFKPHLNKINARVK